MRTLGSTRSALRSFRVGQWDRSECDKGDMGDIRSFLNANCGTNFGL
jgi:hypothetical protein